MFVISADPGFYVPNWLFLGKCHMQLGHKEEAQRWLTKASEYPSELPEIVEVRHPEMSL